MAEEDVKINITANGSAETVAKVGKVASALKTASTAVGWVTKAVNGLKAAFDWFGAIKEVVGLVVDAFTWLRDKLTENARAAQQFAFSLKMGWAKAETDRLIGSHDRLLSIMREETQEMQRQNTLRDNARRMQDEYEDAKRAAERQAALNELLDPADRQDLLDAFADEDEQIARRRRERDRQTQIDDLEGRDSIVGGKVRMMTENNADILAQIEKDRKLLADANGREDEESAKAIRERINALEARRKANAKEIEQFALEQEFLRKQIEQLENAPVYTGVSAAKLARDDAREQRRIDADIARADRENEALKAKAEEDARPFPVPLPGRDVQPAYGDGARVGRGRAQCNGVGREEGRHAAGAQRRGDAGNQDRKRRGNRGSVK